MHEYGFWSLLPPIIAIVLAIRTKQVFVSLFVGIWLGWIVVAKGNVISGSFQTIEAFVNVFKSEGNTRTIMFSLLIGSLILFMQRSGGVAGFVRYLNQRMANMNSTKKTKSVQFLAWLTGILIFVESNISVLTVGTLFRPAFDNLKISREKLAYIADSSSAPTCILVPFNAWGAFIMGLLLAEGYSNPFGMLMNSLAFNFYPILALLLVFGVIYFNWNIGPMEKAERRTSETGQLLWPNAQPMVSESLTQVDVKPGVKARSINMLLPLITMVAMMPVMLVQTGWSSALEQRPDAPVLSQALSALGQGSGSTAVLISIVTALLIAIILYATQKLFNLKETIDVFLKGMEGMLPLALLMVFAFAISAVCAQLHTGQYVASLVQGWLSPKLIPFLLFLVSAFIAFSTGTSWGTFAIMITIAMPVAQTMQANELITLAAVLGGGVFGDHCSPISDTTIVSSMAAATDHIDHVQTQLPYALLSGAIAAFLYLILGFI